MFNLLRVAFAGAIFLPIVFADNMFAGCYSKNPGGTAAPATGPATRDSSDLCNAACYNTHTHSYYRADTKQCLCSNGTPYRADLMTGGPNACGSNYDNRVTKTSFMALEPRCYATRPAGITPTTFTGLNGCLVSCKNSIRATYWANTNPGATNYYCACQTPSSYGAEGTCGPNAFFGFYHTPQAAVSGLTRRQEREELVAMNDAEKLYCPRGWTACLVEGAEDDTYECVDTYSDLESCGGCLSGQFNGNSANSTVGEDCSLMRGAVLGGSTCLNGRCQAYACSRGYQLQDGQCVRNVRR